MPLNLLSFSAAGQHGSAGGCDNLSTLSSQQWETDTIIGCGYTKIKCFHSIIHISLIR